MFSYRIVLRSGLIMAAAIGLFLLSNSANAEEGSHVTPVAGSDFTRGQMAFPFIDGSEDAKGVSLRGVGNGSVSIEFYSADGELVGTALGIMPNDVGNLLQIIFNPHPEVGESSCVQDFFDNNGTIICEVFLANEGDAAATLEFVVNVRGQVDRMRFIAGDGNLFVVEGSGMAEIVFLYEGFGDGGPI